MRRLLFLVSLSAFVACSTVEDTRVRDAEVALDAGANDLGSVSATDLGVTDSATAVDAELSEDAIVATDGAELPTDAAAADATLSDAAVAIVCGPGVAACPSGQYCHYEDGSCGLGDSMGVCVPSPSFEACVMEGRSDVCGCNGRNYRRACEALYAGVDVAASTVCPAHAGCAAQDVMALVPTSSTILGYYFDGSACQALRGDGCTGTACGALDGTYEACVARHVGCNLGAVDGIGCGPLGAACGADQFCDFADSSCGSGGQIGVCQSRPTECSGGLSRITCGCDNVSYTSTCHAQLAGVDTSASRCVSIGILDGGLSLVDGGRFTGDLGLVRADLGLIPFDP